MELEWNKNWPSRATLPCVMSHLLFLDAEEQISHKTPPYGTVVYIYVPTHWFTEVKYYFVSSSVNRNPTWHRKKCSKFPSLNRTYKTAQSPQKCPVTPHFPVNVVLKLESALDVTSGITRDDIKQVWYTKMNSNINWVDRGVEGQEQWKQPLNDQGGVGRRRQCLCTDFFTSPNSQPYLTLACSGRLQEVLGESGAGRLTKAHHFLYIVHILSRI